MKAYYTDDAQIQQQRLELAGAKQEDQTAYVAYRRKRLLKRIGKTTSTLCIIVLLFIWIRVSDARSEGRVPTVFGYQIYEVATGSMTPTIPVKTLILAKAVDAPEDLKKGDIVTFHDNGVTITHRIVEVVQEQGKIAYRTKGDNPENSIDPNLLTPDRIQAVYQLKLPFRLKDDEA